MIHTIPYFDAHCDTIHRCHTAGTPFRGPELRAFYDIAGDLRRSGGHIDLERAGGFSRYAQFFALYQSPRLVPEGSSMPEQGILLHQRFLREMEENRERILPCRTGAEVDEAVRQGKAAALLSIEGAELLDCDIRRLDTAYDWGVRLLNPVWNYANRLSGSNAQQPEQGLTAYGRDFLRRMEELSIYVDVSHLSDAGFWDVVRLSRRPVVASHSNSRAVCPHRRNLTDDMFRAIRDSGGVAGLNYYQHFVGDDPTMEGLVRHVEHFLELDGERSLCLGGDMDGCELLAPSVGTQIAVDTAYETRRESLLELLAVLDETGDLAKVDAIHLGEASYISMDYMDRFTVKMPYQADFSYKLRVLELAINSDKIQDNMTGTFDMRQEDGQVIFDQDTRK